MAEDISAVLFSNNLFLLRKKKRKEKKKRSVLQQMFTLPIPISAITDIHTYNLYLYTTNIKVISLWGRVQFKVPITPKRFFKQKNIYISLSRMLKKVLILVETSIFCESSKSKKIALIRNTTEPKIRSKESGSNQICDVNPVHQSNVITLAI